MRRSVAFAASSLILGLGLSAVALADDEGNDKDKDRDSGLHFSIVRLVSDQQGAAQTTDPVLVNAWGIADVPGSVFWISDNQTGVTTAYDGLGKKFGGSVVIPGPKGAAANFVAAPTGVIWNPTGQFPVPQTNLPAQFLFATEDGTISAWSPAQAQPNNAVLAVDNSASGAVYKGLAYGNTATGSFLYAANFRAGTIDVYDGTFAPANGKLSGTFSDPQIPSDFAPFNIRNIDGNLYVTYAQQNAQKHDDVAGQGNGFVNIYSTDGQLLRRLARHGALNSPWGIAPVPAGFEPSGKLTGAVLIGNFGDGTIHAYDRDGGFLGRVDNADGQALTIQGLWGLQFGDAQAASPQTLYFTSGPGGESHGLFGALTSSDK